MGFGRFQNSATLQAKQPHLIFLSITETSTLIKYCIYKLCVLFFSMRATKLRHENVKSECSLCLKAKRNIIWGNVCTEKLRGPCNLLNSAL